MKSALSDATWFGHAGDVNRDGRSDVLVRRGDGRLQLMYATSTGQLGVLKTIATAGLVHRHRSGLDVDGNGRLDVVNRKVGGYVDHYELSDSGTLKRVRSMGRPARYYPNVELVQDVDGDGRDDLRGIASGGRMRTWTSQAPRGARRPRRAPAGTRTAPCSSPVTSTAPRPTRTTSSPSCPPVVDGSGTARRAAATRAATTSSRRAWATCPSSSDPAPSLPSRCCIPLGQRRPEPALP